MQTMIILVGGVLNNVNNRRIV